MPSTIDPSDDQFTEDTLDAVRERPDGYELTHDGWTLSCPKVEGLPAPCVGEILRCYGRGIGSIVRGIVVGGRVYRYRTEAEEHTRAAEEQRAQEAEREQAFVANLADTDRRIAALPVFFRERIAKFQRDGGYHFRRDYEAYELFCCEQAVVIADALHTREAIDAFAAAPWEEQTRMVSGLSNDHSGNTFGAACQFARTYITHPEFVPMMHGALVPLVGCAAYGCKHPSGLD